MGRKEGRAPTSSATSISPRAFLSAAATQFSADEEREQRGEAAPGPIASDTVRQFFRFPRPSSSFSSRRYWRSAGHEPKGFSFTASNWWVIKSLPCRNDQRQRKMLKPNAATRFWGKLSCKRGKRKKKGGGGYNSACARFEWMTETGSTDTRRHFFVVVVVVGSHFNSKARVLRL